MDEPEMMENSVAVPQADREREVKRLRERLRETERQRRSVAFFAAIVLPFVLLAVLICFANSRNMAYTPAFDYVLSAAVGLVLGLLFYLFTVLILMTKESAIRHELIENETVAVQNALPDSDAYHNLVKMSFKNLDQYYQQTRDHAQRGFIATMLVSFFGAVLIMAGIVAMFLGFTEPATVTSASGIITEFISAVFFYLYNKTVAGMSNYHNKLVMAQNISIALAAADSLPDDRQAEAKAVIIGELTKNINELLLGRDG